MYRCYEQNLRIYLSLGRCVEGGGWLGDSRLARNCGQEATRVSYKERAARGVADTWSSESCHLSLVYSRYGSGK
ncbi:hypothetical protein EVAR_60413_1 [Eumeta japonica]|uniref:Uncharacterized protein n=1 Tax=Eumeta variegata TaxID=151549 RepID=A0A4C1ZFS5_EUMVA|nr:hypothetical protein EVAR_60413_1 [Eumeta japonica]